jgi:hypothetical protein
MRPTSVHPNRRGKTRVAKRFPDSRLNYNAEAVRERRVFFIEQKDATPTAQRWRCREPSNAANLTNPPVVASSGLRLGAGVWIRIRTGP